MGSVPQFGLRRLRAGFVALGFALLLHTQTASADEPAVEAIPLEQLLQTPAVSITNGRVSARIYLPDAQKGFYRGVRFDWAGMIGSLRYRGHDFYVPWFSAVSGAVRDVAFEGGAVIASPNSAGVGPVEEFNAEGGALGYSEAAPGGVFLKIGVGVLRRLDDAPYSFAVAYPLVDPGRRTISIRASEVTFVQEVAARGTGYGYTYTKRLRLVPGQSSLLIEHELLNTGRKRISTSVYDHNFLNIDGAGTTPGLALSTVFPLSAGQAPDPALAALADNRLTFLSAPLGEQRYVTRLAGFGAEATDYNFLIADPARRAALHVSADRPVARLLLWVVRPVMALEPFITLTVAPGEAIRWRYRYDLEASPVSGPASP